MCYHLGGSEDLKEDPPGTPSIAIGIPGAAPSGAAAGMFLRCVYRVSLTTTLCAFCIVAAPLGFTGNQLFVADSVVGGCCLCFGDVVQCA